MSNLKKYNSKRNFNKTNEPSGKVNKKHKKLRFVVQHHIARKDHYDFRLEFNGVLKSFAVPKGPSYNTKDKRLAVKVEDHPYSYRNFEGCIPAGEYGAGSVMIFDEGYYEEITKFPKNFNFKVIKFKLYGKRLKGKWSLVHFKDDNYLLIKDRDEYNEFSDITKIKTSIRTNRTMKEIEEDDKNKNKVTSVNDSVIEDIKVTHPDKIIFKKDKITKLDIALYYHKVSKRMIPLIKNRIVSTIRCPNGKEKFFMKHLNSKNEGIGKINIKNNSNKKEDYYYIENSSGLISEVQMNSFEFHTWGSNIRKLETPDIMVFDLDPDEKLDIDKLREGVKDLKSILDELKLKSYLKTSGGKGFHVVVPIKKKMTWKKFRETSKQIAVLMEEKWPDKYTSNIRKSKRKNKIFIDWVRNTRGSTSVCPYSIRLRDKCSVSMPISYRELDKIEPNEIDIKEAIKRLKRKDPWEDFFN